VKKTITHGDLVRVWALLPWPVFRQRDIYGVAEKTGFRRAAGQGLWNKLLKHGWIVKTGTPIGKSKRRFYWEHQPSLNMERK
jgi:hypothetical protein